MNYLADLYDRDLETQSQFSKCLGYIYDRLVGSNSKIVLTGMGKSFKIADKLCATMNSLSIQAVALHPSDALHGDLGIIRPMDILIMITSSGDTPELITLLPHLPSGLLVICLTCKCNARLAKAASAVLSADLPDEISEDSVYGLAAPTFSTAACLAVGDALSISLAELLVTDAKERRLKFAKIHPGGSIGQQYRQLT